MYKQDKFLTPGKYIDSMDSRIIEKANNLAGHAKDKSSIVEIFFVFVRNNINYYASSEGYVSSASETLVSGTGDSIGKACLLAALCRVMEIPAGVSFQFIKDMKFTNPYGENNGLLRRHAVANINLDGTWLTLDPSYDWWIAHGRQSRLPGFVKNEGAVIPQKDMEGKENFTVTEESPVFEDIPPEWKHELSNHKNEVF